ncbi:substance-K receptor-like isoform X2 [Actinia tenebrosa]|nr:substance-K receptor-like isoform X2 [Actinia tenebrosa]
MIHTTLSTLITTTFQPTTNETFSQANDTGRGPSCRTTPLDAERVFLIFCYIVIFVVTIAGNGIIIYVVNCYRNIKTAFNLLIVNMAVADILDAVAASPTSISFFIVGRRFPSGAIGEIICKLQMFIQDVSISASVLTLTVIAVDRYFAIVHVLRRPMGVRSVMRAICAIWVVSGLTFMYEFYRMRLVPYGKDAVTCTVVWGVDDPETVNLLFMTDMLMKLIFHYVLPLVVMIIVYTIILLHLWQRKAPGELSDNHQKRLERQKRKVIKMLVTIVTAFAVCWFPVHFNHVMITFHWERYRCALPMGVIMAFYMVAHANAAINPCLYLIFNQNFRDGFKHIFNKIHRRDITIIERTSTTRDVISNATAIPNIGYHPSTPQLTRLNASSSGDEMADSKL